MELALYCPVYGYYEKEGDRIGRGGDYFTSVSVGSLFGELLACQFAEWLGASPGGDECQESGVQCHVSGQTVADGGGLGAEGGKSQVQSPKSKVQSLKAQGQGAAGRVRIVEAGAHRGELAGDILRWLREWRGELYEHLDYCIVEPSERRRGWQQATLGEFKTKVRWANALREWATDDTTGPAPDSPCVIFSNELLDALPVHRFGWDAHRRTWFEWGITLENGRLGWTRMSATADLPQVPLPLETVLPDGFTRDVCPAAVQWWSQASALLRRGRLVTFDYGLTTDESLVPERDSGTVRAYFRHQVSPDVLARPGEQDITAHVDFSAIRDAGESSGLTTEAFVTQSQFLTRIVEKILTGVVSFGEWTSERTRQFQTLTRPEHLGRAFRVLVQSRATKS